jgi:prepilin-type processing-associated H-X9-DG protein
MGVVAIVFGLVTLRAGSNVLFGDGSAESGPAVPFVVWFNFIAAIGYLVAGVGLILRKRWSELAAIALAMSTIIVFAAFGAHVAQGGAYAARTAFAMTLRAGFWIAAAWIARSSFRARSTGAHG